MYYEINVSKNGKHFFATSERSCTTLQHTQEVLEEILTKFPKSEGYSIIVSYMPEVSNMIMIKETPVLGLPIYEMLSNLTKFDK